MEIMTLYQNMIAVNFSKKVFYPKTNTNKLLKNNLWPVPGSAWTKI